MMMKEIRFALLGILMATAIVSASGQLHHFLVEASGGGPVGNQIAGMPLFIQIVAQDSFNTTVTGFTGTVDIISPGTLTAGGGPSGAFTNGVLTSEVLAFSNTGNFTITATRTGGTETGTSNSFSVAPAALHHFDVEEATGSPIGTQTVGSPFFIQITARDTFNNEQNNFTGTVDISSTGTLSTGGGTTGSFTSGILASHQVTVSLAGIFTLTATQTTGSESGTSNTFTVNNLLPEISRILPPSATAGGPGFTLTVNGYNFAPTSSINFDGVMKITALTNETTLTATVAAPDIDTAGIFPVTVVTPAPGGGISNTENFTVSAPVIRIRVMLEGPFQSGTMSTVMQGTGLVPVSQPFSTIPWNYAGTESVIAIPPGVVDWILIELRSGTSGGSRVGRRAAFIRTGGTVTDIDGVSPVEFPGIAPGAYHVIIRHRNHIAVMSAQHRPMDAIVDSCDFTTTASFYFGGSARTLNGGLFGMYAGDYSGDDFIDASDFSGPDNDIFISGYRRSDLNLDGFIDASDFTYPDNNIFVGSNVPD